MTMLATILDLVGMRQAELCRRTGLSTKHINQIIKGHVPMTVPVAVALEGVLGIDAAVWMAAEASARIAEERVTLAAAPVLPVSDRWCGRRRGHPAHRWLHGRQPHDCPGTQPTEET